MELIKSQSRSLSTKNLTLVEVYFINEKKSFMYLCESIELNLGNRVYVTGKFSGQLGIVVDVRHQFKVRPSRYERIVMKVDMNVQGDFYIYERFLLSLHRQTIPKEKVSLWFMPPVEEETFISTFTIDPFPLEQMLEELTISSSRLERGIEYFKDNRVKYLVLDKTHGYAIIEGSEMYEVEFIYEDDLIQDISCTCYCDGHCKHEVATLLELRIVLDEVMKGYQREYSESQYIAAIDSEVFWREQVAYAKRGKFTFYGEPDPVHIN